MNITEHLLWKYIDGDCTSAETAAIIDALSEDADALALYQSLLAYHKTFLKLFAHQRKSDSISPASSGLPKGFKLNCASSAALSMAHNVRLNCDLVLVAATLYLFLYLLNLPLL